MIEELKDKGWYLTDEGLEICKNGLTKVTTAAVIQRALDTDLREIGGPFLSDEVGKDKVDTICGPCVLQIQKLKNVSAPKYDHNNSFPPLLRLLVTDGHTYASCLQWDQWKSITLDTPPGTKIFIKPLKVPVQNGILLLNEKHFTLLGGHVTAMVEKWELSKSFASQTFRRREGSEDSAPPWVPFGKSINYKDSKAAYGDFRSLEQEAKEEKEHGAFKQQRMANIAEVSKAKEGKVKVFGGGKDKQTNSSSDPAYRNGSSQGSSSVNDRREFVPKSTVDNSPSIMVRQPQNNSNYNNNTFDAQRTDSSQYSRTDYRKPETERFQKYDQRNRYEEQKQNYSTKSESQYGQRNNTRNQANSSNDYGHYNNYRNSGGKCEEREASDMMSQMKIQGSRSANSGERNEPQNKSFLKPGSGVLAKYWEDKQFYPATVHAVGENGTCVVYFVEYGNYEEVRVNDIRPLSTRDAEQNYSSTSNSQHNTQNRNHFTGVLEFRRGGNKPFVHRSGTDDYNQDVPRAQKQYNKPAARLYQPPRLRKQ